MMRLPLTFFKTFHFQNNNFFYFSNNRAYVGDLKHHCLPAHKDTCVSCKARSSPGGLAARAQGLGSPGPVSAAGPSLSGGHRHVAACLGLRLLPADLCPSPVPSPREVPDAQGCPGAPPAALLPAGAVGRVLAARPRHDPPGSTQRSRRPAPGSCWPPQCPDVELCVAFVFQFYFEQYLVISIMFTA